jgi:hypothetical protein
MRNRSTLAAVLALGTALAACGGSAATPAPTAAPTAIPTATAAPATPSPAPTAAPSATAAATTAPTDTAAPGDLVPATASDPKVSGKGVILNLPADWLVIALPDIKTEAGITAWLAAHPAVDKTSMRAIASTMTASDIALMAFDTANKSGVFTPNLSITFADAPAGDMTAFLAEQAKQIKDTYSLDAAFEYQSFSPAGGMAGFLGDYTWTAQALPLAGLQLILPMDARLAILTFTALASQTSHYGTVLEPLFSAVKQQ